jgi:hypothetical protein
VIVTVKVPPGTRSKSVDVKFSAEEIFAGLKDQPPLVKAIFFFAAL